MSSTLTNTKPRALTAQEAYAIAMEAYTYFYPLVTMEITRRQMTNIEAGKMIGRGPINTFVHVRQYPEADFKVVVRPNFDTLYSAAWLDLTKEPMILSLPDTDNRYYLMPILDMWTDVFAAPGWRTTGTDKQHYAIVAPDWKGALPDGVTPIQAPTPYVWIIGRTKTDGPSDYDTVHKIQDGYLLAPLSQWGKTYTPPAPHIDSSIDMKTPPLEQVNNMKAKDYFKLAAELMKLHKPHATDWSIVARLQRLGIEAGKSFDMSSLAPDIQQELEKAAADALKLQYAKVQTIARSVNGWQMNTDTMGVYGNYYLKRATVAMLGLGANQEQDAIYPLNYSDADGRPLDGSNKYVMRFSKDELPPVDAFWSITMYDKDGFQSANSLNRFAISSWMPLVKNSDGALEIYIQHENPGKEKEANWLPAPKGELGVTMRLYAPKPACLYGDWNPPAVKLVK